MKDIDPMLLVEGGLEMSNNTLVPLLVVTNSMTVNADPLIISFPDRIFYDNRKNGSGQLPILFSFKYARECWRIVMLDVIKDCIPHCVLTIY